MADLNKLDPKAKELALALKARAKAEMKRDIIFPQTLRSTSEQNAKWAIGRTVKGAGVTKALPMGRTVTNAKGGESYHNYGLAFDVAFAGPDPYDGDFKALGKIGKSLGLEWGGDWPGKFKDMPHFQYTYGLTIKQLLAGQRPPKPQPEINPEAMIVKITGNGTLYIATNYGVAVPINTDFATYQVDFKGAKIVEMKPDDFAKKYKISKRLKVTA